MGEAGDQRRVQPVARAALGDVLPLFQAVFQQAGQEGVGGDLVHLVVVAQLVVHGRVDAAPHLLLEGGQQVCEALEAGELAGVRADGVAVEQGAAAVQSAFQAEQHLDVPVGELGAPVGQGLPAAVVGVVAGVLHRNAQVLDHAGDHHVVVEDGRLGAALGQPAGRGLHDRLRGVLVQAQGDQRVDQLQLVDQVEHQVGQLVGAIPAVGREAADDAVLQPVVLGLPVGVGQVVGHLQVRGLQVRVPSLGPVPEGEVVLDVGVVQLHALVELDQEGARAFPGPGSW